MTIANDLFVRLLAMDAYFRGVDAPPGLAMGAAGIGTAVFLGDQYLPASAPAEGFYAAAYTINGVTVISYRGTDAPWTEFPGTDFPLMSGAWQDESVQLAMAFYDSVDAATDNPILLTGHSLGGGLAGFVASLMNRPATLVDHIGFMTARAKRARRKSRAPRRPRPATAAALDARASLA